MACHQVNHSDGAECIILLEDVQSQDFDVKCITNNSAVSNYFNQDFNGSLRLGDAETSFDRGFEKTLKGLHCGSEFKMSVFVNKSILSSEKDGVLYFTLKFLEIRDCVVKEWSDEQKIERAVYLKQRGVTLFQQNRYEDSFFMFSRSLKLILWVDSLDNSDTKVLLLNLYSNLCLCHMKKGNFYGVLSLSNDGLQMDDTHVKLLYHKGCAETELRNYGGAREAFKKALIHDPKNNAVLKKFAVLVSKEKEEGFKNIAGLKKMFGFTN